MIMFLYSTVDKQCVVEPVRLCLDQGFGKGQGNGNGNGNGNGRWFNGTERLDCLTFSFTFCFPSPNPWSKHSLRVMLFNFLAGRTRHCTCFLAFSFS